MAVGRAETYDQRSDLLGRILMRNRVVGVLRVVVPALGLAAFAVLAIQIYIANLARQYGVSGIRIDRGIVVVETPKYSGTGSDGSRYLVTAREARTPLDRSNMIDLTDATLELLQSSGVSYFAKAATASMDTTAETVDAPGTVAVTGTDGLEGTLTDVAVDSKAEIIISNGPVDLLLSDGTTIVAASMVHEGKPQLWTFTRATVVVPDLPADAR
jgi:lipopolysaccharide export system protein LptC